jgi:hypothetical protein
MSEATVSRVRSKSVPPFGDEYNEEVYLVVKRDIPAIQSNLSEIKQEMEDMSAQQRSQSDEHAKLVHQFESLSGKVDGFRLDQANGFAAADKRFTQLFDEIKLIANKEELPWYKSFEKVMILLLVLGLGTLAGVKSYGDVITKIPAIVGGGNSETTINVAGEGP